VGDDSPARIEFRGGGSAANVAAWGQAALVGRVGADARGTEVAEGLRAAGVSAFLAVDEHKPTGTCLVLVGPDGERTMFPDPGANDGLLPADVPPAALSAGGHLHVAGYALLRAGSRPAARSAIERARAAGMTVSIDPSSAALLTPEFFDFAAAARLLLPNAAEATALAGRPDPVQSARALAGRFGEVVVKLGAEGAVWTDGDEEVHARALPVSAVVDTTGAGDSFAAGLLRARLSGAAPAEALAAGCELAAQAVATPGARPSR
jgi:sugar/nucleoside kinase (ribokinase family)